MFHEVFIGDAVWVEDDYGVVFSVFDSVVSVKVQAVDVGGVFRWLYDSCALTVKFWGSVWAVVVYDDYLVVWVELE